MAERTVQLSRTLAAQGHNCTILTLDLGLTRQSAAAMPEMRVIALPCLGRRFFIPRPSFATVRRAVDRSDMVHLMGHWTILNALVYACVRRRRKPYVICPAGTIPIFGRSRRIKSLYNFFVGDAIIRNAARCIVTTRLEGTQLEQFGVRPSAIAIIANGISPAEYGVDVDAGFREAHGIPDVPLVLFMGRLNPIKGPDLLVRAFCASKQCFPHHLVLAGPDEGMRAGLEAIVRENNAVGRVHFLGYIGGSEKAKAYCTSDLLVVPSRSEAMSIVALEAGATATPVLLTDQCGFDEVARVGGGRVVSASVESLQQALVELLSDPAALATMGQNLKRHVCQHYTWEQQAIKHIDMYRDILNQRRADNGSQYA
jgi:glycosyltransferase involved in cell wall biosynthesis